jgi:hypothetical protein
MACYSEIFHYIGVMFTLNPPKRKIPADIYLPLRVVVDLLHVIYTLHDLYIVSLTRKTAQPTRYWVRTQYTHNNNNNNNLSFCMQP